MKTEDIYKKYALQPILRCLAINHDKSIPADDVPYLELTSRDHTVDKCLPESSVLVDYRDNLYTVPAGTHRPTWPDDFKPFDPNQDYIIYSYSEPDQHFVDIATVRSFYDRQKLIPFRFVRISEPEIVDGHAEFLCKCDTLPDLYRFLYVLADDLPIEEAWNPEEIPDGIEKVKEA